MCDNYASTQIFSMVNNVFLLSTSLFVFPLIFIYDMVYLRERTTIQFIETIDYS